MNKKILTAIIFILMIISIIPATTVFAAGSYTYAIADHTKDINDSGIYKTVKTYSTFSEAYEAMTDSGNIYGVVLYDGDVIAMKGGIVVTKVTNSGIFQFENTLPNGYNSYTSKNQVAYYLSNHSSSRINLKISAYEGVSHIDNVKMIPLAFCYPYNKSDSPNRHSFDYYTKNSSGDLVHYISTYSTSNGGKTSFSSITIDKAPDFMVQGGRYYSTDGYNYYELPYDAQKENNLVGQHAVYYQNLSFRTKSSYNAGELNSYINEMSSDSAYSGYGSAFITAQNTYGVNAAMELAFANHESAYGDSSLAHSNYNFFGVGAVDSNPGSASEYKDPKDGILQHAKYYMNRYYFDAHTYIDKSLGTAYYDVSDKSTGYISKYTGDSRYFGTNPGNKHSGINVRYASDPFHGEKVAGHMYRLDKYLGMKDYGEYSIGRTLSSTYAYSEPDVDSWKLYKYTCSNDNYGTRFDGPVGMTVTIVGDTGKFYKVLSDTPVNEDKRSCYAWNYDHDLSYAYVLKSEVEIIFDGGNIPVEDVKTPHLKSLEVKGYDIGFSETVYDYSLTVENDISKVEISAEGKDGCDVKIDNKYLSEGVITKLTVTVSNDEKESVYTIHVFRKESSQSSEVAVKLDNLSSDDGEFMNDFDGNNSNHTLIVGDIDKDISFEYDVDENIRVEILGGTLEGSYRLYTIVLTDRNGEVGIYRIKVIEE